MLAGPSGTGPRESFLQCSDREGFPTLVRSVIASCSAALRVEGEPVAFSRNKEQSDAARNSKDRTVIKHSGVTDVIPQETCDNACDQSQKSNDGAVPANGTGAQEFRHKI